jgi:hypothetical protein
MSEAVRAAIGAAIIATPVVLAPYLLRGAEVDRWPEVTALIATLRAHGADVVGHKIRVTVQLRDGNTISFLYEGGNTWVSPPVAPRARMPRRQP